MLAYEELKGASGHEVRFRAPRYEARKLFPQSPPRVRVKSNSYRLHNISLGGVAVISSQGAEGPLHVGEVVPLTIHQSGLSIFESNARVCRTEHTIFGSKIAFNFVDDFIDFNTLLNRNSQARIATRASMLSGEAAQLVPKTYRRFCADVLYVLRAYRDIIDDNAALAHRFERDFDRDSTYDACEGRLLQHWRSLWRTGNEIAEGIIGQREVLNASKEFTELLLTPEMRLGCIWDRSYEKPLGYPGDFEVMSQVYDWERRGETVYSMLLHRLGLEVAECIKTRMEVVRAAIAETVNGNLTGQPAKIMSLGCGPAREVELFLGGTRAHGKPADFTLIDQEQLALQRAFERIHPHVVGMNGLARVQCLHMSFMDILRGADELERLPPQNLIYSVGLIDYLGDRRAAALVRRLYSVLASKGLLIIGNMNKTAFSNLWPMEFIADWSLHYRTETDMMAWVEGLQPASAWTETESTDRVRLLFLQKR